MAKPLRTNDPVEWTALDGVYIDELKPPGRIVGRGPSVVNVIGQFAIGPYNTPLSVGSSKDLLNKFGGGSYSGYQSLMGKRFSNLVVTRVKGGLTTKAAFATFMDGADPATASIVVTDKNEGADGNNLKAVASAVVGDATKVCITVTYNGTVLDRWAKVDLASLPLTGQRVILTKAEGADALPDVATAQTVTLSQGSDGTVTDASYTEALAAGEAYEGIKIVFADTDSEDVNLALIAHCNLMGDRIPILHEPVSTDKAEVITAAGNYRGAMDRGILAWPWVYQYNIVSGVTELSNPAAWVASALSMIPSHWDPAVTDAAEFFAGIKGLEYTNLTRLDYIELKNAGVMAFEYDPDYGYKIKSGITLSLDPALTMVFRIRMSDMITGDIAKGLKPYQNKPMNQDNQDDCIGAVTKYLQGKKDKKEIEDYSVDGESMNTSDSLANGEFHILAYVKLFSSMRYIVLHAQVGETVTITPVEGGTV